MRVIVTGRLKSRQYETREGEKRTAMEIDVEEVGPALRYATAKVARAARSGGGGGYGASSGGGAGAGGGDPWSSQPSGQPSSAPAGGGASNDPWAAPGVGNDEPPF